YYSFYIKYHFLDNHIPTLGYHIGKLFGISLSKKHSLNLDNPIFVIECKNLLYNLENLLNKRHPYQKQAVSELFHAKFVYKLPLFVSVNNMAFGNYSPSILHVLEYKNNVD